MTKPKISSDWMAGCAGCHMSLLDMDERIALVAELAELRSTPITDLKHPDESGVDVGILEGGINNTSNEEVARLMRSRCKILVALGDCAVFGGVPAMRNFTGDQAALERAYVQTESTDESGKIPEAFVDESAFRVLMMKNQLGLFENPFAGLGKSGKLTLHNREKAYQLAGESCVLLKNDKILPLSMKKKVIWAGPYTASRELLSRWSIFGEHEAVETIEDVLQRKQIEAECITGCNILSDAECKVWQVEQELSGKPRDEQWLETITHEDTVVCVLGEHESQSGEAASRAFLTLPEEQQVLFEKIAERTSNIVTVVIAGRPLDLRRISEYPMVCGTGAHKLLGCKNRTYTYRR